MMKRNFMAAVLTVAYAVTVPAQQQQTSGNVQATNETSASVTQTNKSLNLQSDAKISGELQNTLDARKAKVGDQVVLKTTSAIKQGGHTVVNKGARLIGSVTTVEAKTTANGQSRIGVLFDRLDNGSMTAPITATISSITQATAHAQSNEDTFGSDVGASSMSSSQTSMQRAPAQGGNGGLLGGVSNTAGGVVSTAGSTVGGAAGGATSAAGNTVRSTARGTGEATSGLGRSLGRIQISEASDASASGGSQLTLQGENLRLEKGTTFNLLLSQSSSAGASRQH